MRSCHCHGVGHCLNVHEPPSVSGRAGQSVLKAGMVLSNEPGYYLDGKYGIRIESMMIVIPARFQDFSHLRRSRQCHLSPFIDGNLLSSQETAWIEKYYQGIREKVVPYLSSAEQQQIAEYMQI